MAQGPTSLTESERRAFVDKVFGFRATLSPGEQRLLDGMIVSATAGATGAGDVQLYGLLDPAQHLGSVLMALLAQIGETGLLRDDQGEAVGYIAPLA